MPEYRKSKSQKRSSQSQSKNGGRRRKNTMRKLRRGKKSRKVMRGGQINEYTNKFPAGSNLVADILNNDKSIIDKNSLEDYIYNPNFKDEISYKDLFGVAPPKNNDRTKNQEVIVEYLDSGGVIKPQQQ